MVLTGRAGLVALLGAAVVGGLVAAGVPGLTSLLVVNAVVLALVALDVVRATSPRMLALTRSGDVRVRLGEVASVALDVRNAGRRRWRGLLRDAWAPTAGATIARAADLDDTVAAASSASGASTSPGSDRCALDLAPGESVRIPIHVRPTRRGDRPTDRVTLRSLGPLGVAGRQRSLTLPWSVRTLPPFSSRRHLPSRLARLRDLDGRQAIAVRAQGTEFDSLREYVAGDDVRSIDWRATARAADVMVRTWRPERDRRVVIVLDTGRTCAARIGDETRLDVSMDAALLLAALAGRAGDRVDLVAHDRRTRVQLSAGSGAALLPDLVDALAPLEPELTETDYRGMVSVVLSRVRKRALVVLLAALDRPAMEEGLLPALPALTARHTVIVAAVRAPDPELDRTDVDAAYHHAATGRAALDRAAVTARMARMGVVVVDADPESLAPRLADAYLDLKAAGRL